MVTLWDVGTRRDRATLTGHSGLVRKIAFSPTGELLAVAAGDSSKELGEVKIWNVQDASLHATLPSWESPACGLAFAPDGKSLAATNGYRHVYLYDFADTSETRFLRETGFLSRARGALDLGSDEAFALAFAPDGRSMATGGAAGVISLWDVSSRRVRFKLAGKGNVWSVAFSPDGSLLATGGDEREVRIWETATGRAVARLPTERGHVRALAFAPHGRTLFSATGSWYEPSELAAWDMQSLRRIASVTQNEGGLYCLGLSPDGTLLAAGGIRQQVKLWRIARESVPSTDLLAMPPMHLR